MKIARWIRVVLLWVLAVPAVFGLGIVLSLACIVYYGSGMMGVFSLFSPKACVNYARTLILPGIIASVITFFISGFIRKRRKERI